MTNISLSGTNATQIQSNFGGGFTLQNNGPGNVYIDNYPSVSPKNSWTLIPGMSIPVQQGATLWVCTDVGVVANVQTLIGVQASAATITEINGPVDIGEVTLAPGSEVSVNGPVAISGTVPISGNVGISGPVTVNGSVGISSGTVNIGTVSGAVALTAGNVVFNKNQNAPTLLASSAGVGYSGVTGTTSILNTSLTGLSSYASLIIVITRGYSAFQALAAGNYLLGLITFTVAGGATARAYQPQWLLDTTMECMIQVPVITDTATLFLEAIKSIAGQNGTIAYSVYGSGEVISSPVYISQSTTLFGELAIGGGYVGVATTATPVAQFMSSKYGECHIEAFGSSGASSGVMDLSYCDTGSAVFYAQSVIGLASPQQKDLVFPMLPILLSLTCTAGASTIASFVQP